MHVAEGGDEQGLGNSYALVTYDCTIGNLEEME